MGPSGRGGKDFLLFLGEEEFLTFDRLTLTNAGRVAEIALAVTPYAPRIVAAWTKSRVQHGAEALFPRLHPLFGEWPHR